MELTVSPKNGGIGMKSLFVHCRHVATVALMLNLGFASLHAQQNPVKMKFSGTASDTVINLQIPNTFGSEYNLTGNGSLGSFTFRTVSASAPSQNPPSTCSGPNHIYGQAVAGGGVFRFADGSLMKANLTGGSDCIDLLTNQALCIRVFQITGGTGRFKNASGTLTFTETLLPFVADATQNPVLFGDTGVAEGWVFGVGQGEDSD
jgi:hypothetical protein